MRILKNSTNVSGDYLHEIATFVLPAKVKSSRMGIVVRNSRTYSAHWSPDWDRDRVVLSIGDSGTSTMKFPYFIDRDPSYTGKHRSGGYLDCLLLSREELIVNIMSHEFRHAWQCIKRRGYRVWGARGQFSERDADAYAIKMTRKWRREHYKDAMDLGYFEKLGKPNMDKINSAIRIKPTKPKPLIPYKCEDCGKVTELHRKMYGQTYFVCKCGSHVKAKDKVGTKFAYKRCPKCGYTTKEPRPKGIGHKTVCLECKHMPYLEWVK